MRKVQNVIYICSLKMVDKTKRQFCNIQEQHFADSNSPQRRDL